MSQPTWITPAGSLGVIPEGIFYQQSLLATTPAINSPTNIASTTAVTNVITCGSTAGVVPGMVVVFTGTNFGNLEENTTYYVLTVPSATTFTITAIADSQTPVALTTATGYLVASFYQRVYYRLIAGTLPGGVQITGNGVITGVPQAVTNLQGVPFEVSEDVTSKFVVRAFTLTPVANSTTIDSIQDRTFTLTITGNDVPEFITPAGSIGTYYDGDYVDIQLAYTGLDPNESNIIRLVAGQLPLGTRLTTSGLISGYIQPFPNQNELVGYDLTPSGVPPYDFVVAAISKNYQFTLEITDGKTSSLRTYTIYVYNRDDLSGDNTTITGDNTFVTADETTERAPFLLNFEPNSLGVVRSDNYYAYRFVGQDYDTNEVEYAITVNQGTGLPPGLTLDRYTGWYYGFIPDQGTTEIDYSFNIQVRARTLVCTATTAGANTITCDTAVRVDVYIGARIVFEGKTFGGIVAGQFYFVASIPSATTITVSTVLGGSVLVLTTASGDMLGVPRDLPSSRLYPFELTIVGAVDQEVTWLTDSDLGQLENGSVSLFKVEAVNRGGRKLFYRLASGEFNQLPQGLEILTSGEIAGRASFNTFSIDLGTTTFDASQSTVSGIEETTFDLTFVFTVNAYATDPTQSIFEVAGITVVNGGLGYSPGATSPVISISSPSGSLSSTAEAGAVTVIGSSITAVAVADPGAGYISPALVTVTQGYGGSGAILEPVMRLTGLKEIVSVFKTFVIKLVRVYNKPYQNLFVLAMPPQNDRVALRELLSNTEIFPPEYIYRPDDANFGLSTQVKYDHAFGLAPDTYETYVSSLYENHYWKNLILGAIETAQAIDPVTGEVVYEVVYSKIVDNLVNNNDQSVAKIVTLPYPVLLDDSSEVFSVYPNSLINMRDQVIDVVGQLSTKLPLWMTSKQSNGRVLGFTPAWVICYTNPGRSSQIAYYFNQYSDLSLNNIDFKVDRYELDTTLSKNWDPSIQNWTPEPSLTTFDRINATGYVDLGLVQACTTLAFADVNGRTVDYINNLGGLDGKTWFVTPGTTPPTDTQVIIRNGSRIVFVRQENFDDPITDIDDAWSDYLQPFDTSPFDTAVTAVTPGTFDYATQVLGGFVSACSETDAATDAITCDTTANMSINDKVYFTGSAFGGIEDKTNLGQTQVYYVTSISNIRCSATVSSTDRITCTSNTKLSLGDEVYFKADTVESTATQTEALGDFIQLLTVDKLVVGMPIQFFGTTIGGIVSGTIYYVASFSNTSKKITISATYLGPIFALNDATGSMSVIAGGTFGNLVDRLATGLARPYYVVELFGGTQFQVSDTPGGTPVQLSNSNGVMFVYYGEFQVSETLGGTPVPLTTDTGAMSVNYANNRMGIYIVSIDAENTLQLTLDNQTVTDDYVTSTQGARFAAGTFLYRPAAAAENLTRVNWQPLITNTTVVTAETIFDRGSLQFIEPVDMYNTSDEFDKYLVFPKSNILA
jgi:hypothetical protein